MPRPMIAEPATSLTDMVLAGQTFSYADRLRKGPAKSEKAVTAWSLAMTAVGVAALAGALTHAIYEGTGIHWLLVVRRAAWKVVGLATVAASAFMLVGSIMSGVSSRRRKPYLALAAFKAGAFAVVSWWTGNFLYTILDYVASMFVVLYLQLRNWRTSAAAPWLVAGILTSFVAAAIQQSGIALHRRFNQNDLYHVVQMGAFHLLHEGARREEDHTGEVEI